MNSPAFSSTHFHLAMLAGMGPAHFQRLAQVFGSVEEALLAPMEDLVARAGLDLELATRVAESGNTLEESLDLLEQMGEIGAEAVFPASPEIPSRILASSKPEWHCLIWRGEVELLERSRVIGVVGRRRATPEGLHIAHQLAAELGKRGVATISGMATGIDRAAHLGSISEEGGTIGVLPLGLFSFYRENREFIRQLGRMDRGVLLVSGCHPLQPWSVGEAMRRNSWIASWCDALVVVEAGEKGGTWKTAREASKRGRPVWVFGGFAEPASGEGNLLLERTLRGTRLEARATVSEWADRILEGLA